MASTTAQNFEQVGGSQASQHSGFNRVIIGDGASTRTLTAKESGALILLDLTGGKTITLPTPSIGLQFEFLVTVSATSSGVYKVITAAATQFLLGAVTIGTIATASAGGFAADGTSIVAINMDATTKGGLAGGRIKLTAISTTQWAIEGFLIGSGSIATGFATT